MKEDEWRNLPDDSDAVSMGNILLNAFDLSQLLLLHAIANCSYGSKFCLLYLLLIEMKNEAWFVCTVFLVCFSPHFHFYQFSLLISISERNSCSSPLEFCCLSPFCLSFFYFSIIKLLCSLYDKMLIGYLESVSNQFERVRLVRLVMS